MATSFSGGRSLERITDSGQATGKLYHLRLRVIKGSNEIVYDRTRKRLHLMTGDCLIEVTAWAGLAVSFIVY
jgi:hypothetical protein